MSEFIRNLFREDFRELEEKLIIIEEEAYKKSYKKSYDEGVRIGIKKSQTKIVRNLLDMEFPHDMIAKATGMDLSEVEALAAARESD